MKCPDCSVEMERLDEEVDIGVGNLAHLLGYGCAHCGENYPACRGCGSIDRDNCDYSCPVAHPEMYAVDEDDLPF